MGKSWTILKNNNSKHIIGIHMVKTIEKILFDFRFLVVAIKQCWLIQAANELFERVLPDSQGLWVGWGVRDGT